MKASPQLPELSQRWATDLDSWAIPDRILDQAAQEPWVHPVAMFTVDGEIADSPSHQRAREAVPEGGGSWTSVAAEVGRRSR